MTRKEFVLYSGLSTLSDPFVRVAYHLAISGNRYSKSERSRWHQKENPFNWLIDEAAEIPDEIDVVSLAHDLRNSSQRWTRGEYNKLNMMVVANGLRDTLKQPVEKFANADRTPSACLAKAIPYVKSWEHFRGTLNNIIRWATVENAARETPGASVMLRNHDGSPLWFKLNSLEEWELTALLENGKDLTN